MEGLPSGVSLGDLGAKFGRKFALTIKPAYEVSSGKYVPISDEDEETIVISNPLTVEFEVRRDTLASANCSTFRIYNLSENIRNRLYKDPFSVWHYRPIMFQAGYNDPLPAIFIGNIKQAVSYRDEGSVNVVTEIQCYDYAFAMSNAHSSWTVDSPIGKRDVIARLIGDLKDYEVTEGSIGDFTGSYARGYAVSGMTWKELQKETGSNVFIDNGKIHCLKDNDCFEGDITVISSETGLLGSPKRADTVITADIIFEPRLQVGQVVELQSDFNSKMNGQYKVIGISHSGTISDSIAGKCKTTVQLFLGSQILNILGNN